MGMEAVVAFIVDWAARRVASQLADRAMDTAVDRIWTLIGGKLGTHPGIVRFRDAAVQTGHVPPDVGAGAVEALKQAEHRDQAFARALEAAVQAAMAVRARVERHPSTIDVKGGNAVGDIYAAGPVNIKQRVVNYAERHPTRFLAIALVVVLVLSSATYGGVRQLSGTASQSTDRTIAGHPHAPEGVAPGNPRVESTFSVQGSPSAIAFSPAGDTLAVGVYTSGTANAQAVTVRSQQSGEVVGTMNAAGGGTWVSFSPDGTMLAVSGSQGQAGLWTSTGKQTSPAAQLLDDSTAAGSVPSAFVPKVAEVATLIKGTNSSAMQFWDSPSGAPKAKLDLGPEIWDGMAFDPSSTSFATYLGSTVKVWDRASGRSTVSTMAEGGVQAAAFSPTGQFLATANGSNVSLWDPRTGQVVFTLRGHTDGVTAVAFRPDGNVLVTGSKDGTARVWDLITRKEIAQLPGHDTDDDGVTALAFDPTGGVLATGDGDGVIRLWGGLG
ncbi:WD40 repeat domain-containing protein [Amycolatopsis sp. lyj-346]|uniref:WD40 repeat domain-containing protein n=1 Tax=Amycolatopsis sp. lyj-346 TaxID=2789289 RepID=UPI00397C398C